MKLLQAEIVGLVVAMFLSLGAPPPVLAANADFDGKWRGERIDVTEDPGFCRETTMYGAVQAGNATFVLDYNGTKLTGAIQADGALKLDGDNYEWDYQFQGKASGNRVEGTWKLGNASCRGTWWLEKEK